MWVPATTCMPSTRRGSPAAPPAWVPGCATRFGWARLAALSNPLRRSPAGSSTLVLKTATCTPSTRQGSTGAAAPPRPASRSGRPKPATPCITPSSPLRLSQMEWSTSGPTTASCMRLTRRGSPAAAEALRPAHRFGPVPQAATLTCRHPLSQTAWSTSGPLIGSCMRSGQAATAVVAPAPRFGRGIREALSPHRPPSLTA